MAAAAGSLHHSGSLDVVLPSGKRKQVPWLVDAPPAPPGGAQLAVCLMHGASGGSDSGHLPALAAAVVSAGLPCLRFTCRGGSVEHRAEVCKAVLAQTPALPRLASVRQWVLAGHSMGARVACTVAEQQQEAEEQRGQKGPGLPPIAAVMLFSYPLHPPGRPAELRDALLTQLQLPALLVRGTRDPFSQQTLWDAALPRLGSPRWEQHSVQGGDHALRCSAADGGSDAALEGMAAAVFPYFVSILDFDPADKYSWYTDSIFICGGVLIAPPQYGLYSFVLIAASCVATKANPQVIIGATKSSYMISLDPTVGPCWACDNKNALGYVKKLPVIRSVYASYPPRQL
ncbi:hypothetical protein ABPG75_007582 [Micractinium tetrahymenae]